MYINILFLIIIFFPYIVHLCNHELIEISGTIAFLSYTNNMECTWTFNLSSISNKIHSRNLLLTFRHFDTEFGHDELFIGETIPNVSKYNSKLFRFSGSKLPDPCLIPLRGDILRRSIWIQFLSDQTNTGSGFIIDYKFLVNQSTSVKLKPQEVLIDAEILHPLENKSQHSKLTYTYPYGTISSPNYPQNYPNNIICRWHLYHRNAFIRLYINEFHTELHYDTLTLHLGQNLNNRAMILYEWSGYDIDNKHLFIRNDNLFLIFNTDKSYSAAGFSLQYQIIEKEMYTWDLYENNGTIHSKDYPKLLRTNIEYTWIIHMNSSNEIEINLIDISLDHDYDYLQIITGDIIYSLNTPKSFRFETTNETKLILRTKHSNDEYQYRGFNLTYQKLNKTRSEESNYLKNLPCGKTYSSYNGTIEFQFETLTSFDCLILIEVDDGQNIFLRFDYLNWDTKENYIDIGLFHDPNENQLYHISDTVPGTWFIANESQIWIRFYSSQFSLGISTFRLFYSETIQWSTISSEPRTQILDDNRLFPYRLISLPTKSIYHNLTQAYIWHIKALDDECIKITFQSFEVTEDRRLCFYVKDLFKTTQICNDEQLPFVYHHIGSCIISIEPEFRWILVKYNIQIEKFKKIKKINKVIFNDNHIVLTPPMTMHPFIHIEWLISIDNSSRIIVDITNFDRNTSAELIIRQDKNITKTYLLEKISLTRFCDVLFSLKSSFQIIYKSLSLPIHNQKRSFRLDLYKISETYFHMKDFHYISWKQNQSHFKWTIDGQYNNSIFLANLFSSNNNLLLETTANINLTMTNSSIYIPSSNFDIRYKLHNQSIDSDFILILYEQQEKKSNQNIILNKTSDILETNNYASYNIYIRSEAFHLIDFIIINADNGTLIRLYDLNVNHSEYFLLNSSLRISKGLLSLIGLRFSIKSLKIKIELESLTNNPIKLRYKIRTKSIQNENFSNVTLIIENTTIENFEKAIYRNLRQSIAKVIRKFCLKYQEHCLSEDTDSIRTDHVIIQSYEEQLDNHHLYVSIFIKDPYRQTVALTNDQFLLALKDNQQEIYEDIQHHINLPSNILEQNSLDSIWLYGVCLLALIVLIVVVLMLITIFMRRTSQSTKKITKNKRIKKSTKNISTKNDDSFLISYPVQQIANEDDEQNLSSPNNEAVSSQILNTNFIGNLSPPTTPYYHCPTSHTSYFNSNIETIMKERLHDDEPIPFIDDNLSVTHSRKSSVGWSDKTSLSSRFSLAWKLNRMRSASQNRSILSNEKEKRRYHHRTIRYTQPSTSQES
ncbi:unnamed protein product [Rotaria sp. Silwood1]|nr:unnamed protein product [Rotaria sp. Silwood1]CAF4734330.1 unnamed protein product [Rotaria sp. Silwood1]